MKEVLKSDFYFDLPQSRIAKFPLEKRDESKLLVYKNQAIKTHSFSDISNHLQPGDNLVLNNAKVIPARLYFNRDTGALIEVLLLEPASPSNYENVFLETAECSWYCIIGNLKKWKDGEILKLESGEVSIRAQLVNRENREVSIKWENGLPFGELVEQIGELPLPPYLNRSAEAKDYETYQTVFAKNKGSVAAPTAGLHFTSEVFSALEQKKVTQTEVTLHVGAGTFLPLKSENALNHNMHQEHFSVSKENLQKLLTTQNVAVGTTSLRVLESLYWMGVQLSVKGVISKVDKLEPYEYQANLSYNDAIELLLEYCDKKALPCINGSTEIMILPYYKPKSIKALITNFHLPESTLLMLVASVVGGDWRNIYKYALAQDYRFLSYGDSSLLYVK